MKHSKRQFAKLCGVSGGNLSNYIKRGKVVAGSDGKVDDENPVNKDFLLSHFTSDKFDDDEVIKDLTKLQKEATLRKTVAEADKKELEAAKLRGESIPVDLVKSIISQLGHGFITGFRDMAEGHLLDAAHEAKLDNKQIAKLRGQLVEGINSAMETGVEIANKDLEKVAAEYAVSRKRN